MTMMIALIGEQPLPNFFPIHHYHPDEILFVYTTRTRPYCQHLRDILPESIKVHELEVDPYDMPVIATKLRAALEDLDPGISSPPIFNITGGTKPMMLAAYQLAQKLAAPTMYLQTEGKQTLIYKYTWRNQQLEIEESVSIPECITLRDIFNLHYGLGKWEIENPKKDDGGNFEQAVASVLRTHGYEVMTNIKAMDKQIEIDIAARLSNQYCIIEVKLDKSGTEFKAIQQLTIAWRSLGIYVQKFHIITVSQTGQHKMITDVLGIKVISLYSYDKTTMMFSPADQKLLLDSVEKALKG